MNNPKINFVNNIPDRVDLTNRMDEKYGIEFLGIATRIKGDRYKVLAKGVFGLAVVEVRLIP